MSLHHGLTDLRDNHLTCFTDMLYSSMVPDNLPSQLDILSTGQNYYENIAPTASSMPQTWQNVISTSLLLQLQAIGWVGVASSETVFSLARITAKQ